MFKQGEYTGEMAWIKAKPEHYGVHTVICNGYVLMQRVRVVAFKDAIAQSVTFEWKPVWIEIEEERDR